MNGDISRIPIQSLSGILSLTDILPELPLPAPIQGTFHGESILYDAQLSEDVHRWLGSQDEDVVQSLTLALGSTNTDGIEFKDSVLSDSVDPNAVPPLLKAVLNTGPSIFQHKRGFSDFYTHDNGGNQVPPSSGLLGGWRHQDSRAMLMAGFDLTDAAELDSSLHRQANCSSPPDYAPDGSNSHRPLSCRPYPPPTTGWSRLMASEPPFNVINSLVTAPVHQPGFYQSNSTDLSSSKESKLDSTLDKSFDGSTGSPKKKKKKKKKKHRHREATESRDRTDGETTEYSVVKLDASDKKIALKISLKRPPDDPHDLSDKEAKKKRKKDRSKDKSKKKDKRQSKEKYENDTMESPPVTSAPLSVPAASGNNFLGGVFRQPAIFQEPSQPSTPSLFDGLLTGDLTVRPTNQAPSQQTHAPPTMIQQQQQQQQQQHHNQHRSPLSVPSNYSSYPATPATPSSNLPPANASFQIQHQQQQQQQFSGGYHHPLSPLFIGGRCGDAGSAGSDKPGAEFLFDDWLSGCTPTPQQAATHSILAAALTAAASTGLHQTSPNVPQDFLFDSPPSQRHPALDGGMVTPVGLGGYLVPPAAMNATPPVKQQQQLRHETEEQVPQLTMIPIVQLTRLPEVTATKPRRPAPSSRRPKRRRNELEELQKWSMKEPGAESVGGPPDRTWDQTIGTFSQALGERVKKRKRIARQASNLNSAYVFEDDEDYPKPERRKSIGGSEDEDAEAAASTRRVSGGDDDAATGGAGGDESDQDPQQSNQRRALSLRHASSDGQGRYRSYAGMDGTDGDEQENAEEGSNRRRKKDDDEPFEIRLKEPAENRYPHLKKTTEASRRRRERVTGLGFGSLPATGVGSGGDCGAAIQETGSYKRFLSKLEQALDSVEEIDLLQCCGGGTGTGLGSQDGDDDLVAAPDMNTDDGPIPPEAILPRALLGDLCRDSAKLKATGASNQVSTERLVKLFTILLLNIRDGARVVPTVRPGEDDDQEGRLWRTLAMERVMRSIDSGLTALNIMTSPDMPKEVYVEDVMERTIAAVKFQLINCIYPEFDPAYRVDNCAKETQSSIKLKRSREKDTGKARDLIHLYNRIVEIISNLAELVRIQQLTDNIILALSSLGVAVFFVENVSELQLAALRLVTTLFAQYEPHRKLIMEDILASLARLPSSKKNLRSYRLNSEESIQMLTALALLLVQSVIELPTPIDRRQQAVLLSSQQGAKVKPEDEVLVMHSYHNALRTAHAFLAVFLRKSIAKGEDDYRVIFENFVNDLLLTVNKPEWPAAEMMLSLLGSLLVQQFNNKTLDQTTRVASVDYLGTVASTLRRDAVAGKSKEKDIDAVIKDILHGNRSDDEEEEEEEESASDKEAAIPAGRNKRGSGARRGRSAVDKKKKKVDPVATLDRVQSLRDALLDYLAVEQSDPTVIYARKFYLGQWLDDCTKETERAQKVSKAVAAEVGSNNNEDTVVEESSETVLQLAEERRRQILLKMVEPQEEWRRQQRRSAVDSATGSLQFQGTLDYEDACLVCRYLASLRPFSQSFDVYLSKICNLLGESSVAVRTKAMRCLSAVVEADPNVLSRKDIERSVHARFLDSSTSVREAAIELVGKYLLNRPQLTLQYYPMLADRILDKGISVRKRVIKIFRDICLEQPDFPKIPEVCVKIIRRVNDEEGIKKLVNEVFQNMWFTPVRDKETVKLLQKVMNITDVVAACKETGYDWFEQFLQNLLKKEEGEKVKPVEKACKQIVDCLVQNIMRLEEISGQNNQRLVACLATLHLFTKIRPELMVQSAVTLQPYLNIRCMGSGDAHILHYVARILEVTVPLMEHPSESYLAQLEEDMVKLTLKQGKMVLESCVACLGAVVNKVSKNYALVQDCFQRFFNSLTKFRQELEMDSEKRVSDQARSFILRALFTVGLLCRHFDLEMLRPPQHSPGRNRDEVFEILMFYTEQLQFDAEMRKKALSGLGFLGTRHHDLLRGQRLCTFYKDLLSRGGDGGTDEPESSIADELKCIVLENLLHYLLEDEKQMLEADAKWKSQHRQESLKEMGDVASGMGSTVAQVYLEPILESCIQRCNQVRLAALSVVMTIVRQGLVNIIKTVPYLIAMQTDPDSNIRVKSDTQMQEIDKKFVGFISMKACQGIRYSYRLQRVLQHAQLLAAVNAATAATTSSNEQQATPAASSSSTTRRRHPRNTHQTPQQPQQQPLGALAIRGVRDPREDLPLALNHHLYALLRPNRQYRRSFLNNMLAVFDDTQRNPISFLVYVADNLAHFPYQCQEEPLFLIHHIDLMVSMAGSNLLHSIREVLFPELRLALQQQQQGLAASETGPAPSGVWTGGKLDMALAEEEDEDEAALTARLVANQATALPVVRDAIEASRACQLLLTLKQFFKDVYGIGDSKIQKYSPSDAAKLWEKQLTRRSGIRYNPQLCLQLAEENLRREVGGGSGTEPNLDTSSQLIHEYLEFRRLMLSIDPADTGADSDGDYRAATAGAGAATGAAGTAGIGHFVEGTEGGLVFTHQPYQVAFDQGRNLRVEVPRLDLSTLAAATGAGRTPVVTRSVIPRDHQSSDDDHESDDSNRGGSSRLMLAQSAPAPRRRAAATRNGRGHTAAHSRPARKKRKRLRVALSSSSEEESESDSDSNFDPD